MQPAQYHAARVLLVGKVAEARAMQTKFRRIKGLLDIVRDKNEPCPINDEHIAILMKMFFMGALSHNLAVMIWMYNFTTELRDELRAQIRREHLFRFQVDRLIRMGDRLNERYEPLMKEITQLEKTIQRG